MLQVFMHDVKTRGAAQVIGVVGGTVVGAIVVASVVAIVVRLDVTEISMH